MSSKVDILTRSIPFSSSRFSERQDALEHMHLKHQQEYETLVAKGALESPEESSTYMSNTENAEDNFDHLRGKFPDYINRKVTCAFCLRRFWSAEDLRRHMRTHTGERPFSCDICSRKFTLKHSMLRHRRKHAEGGVLSDDDGSQGRSTPDSTALPSTPQLVAEKKRENLMQKINQLGGSNKNSGDLIGNLLGIQDASLLDEIIVSKSANVAAKLLGVQEKEV